MDLSPWRFRPPTLPHRFWLPPDPAMPLYAARLFFVEKRAFPQPDIWIGWIVTAPDGRECARGEQPTSQAAMAAADGVLERLAG